MARLAQEDRRAARGRMRLATFVLAALLFAALGLLWLLAVASEPVLGALFRGIA